MKLNKIISLLFSIVFTICVVVVVFSYSQNNPKGNQDTLKVIGDTLVKQDTLLQNFQFRILENRAYSVGERLVFDVKYGFVTAGRAIMTIPEYAYHRGRKCYKVEFYVNSLPFFSTFYKVEDKYLSLIDVEGLFPWRFEQRIREGGYKRDFAAEFDPVDSVAITTEGKYRIEPLVHDIVSAFYYTRTLDFSKMRPGNKIHLRNFYKDTTYSLDVKFKGRQKIDVKAGTFNCIIVEPIIVSGSLFKSEGTLFIWLTDDENKIPVMVKSKILIGSITAELSEISGINGTIGSKVK